MKKYNIGIDIDGTLTFSGYFLPYLNEYFGRDIGYEELNKYDFRDIYNVTDEEIMSFFRGEGKNLIFNADLLDGARDTVNELSQKHNVWIITARKPDKLQKATELGCEIFIEDHPDASIDIAAAGIKLYLVDAPYNKISEHENITRVHDWEEIRTIFRAEGIL